MEQWDVIYIGGTQINTVLSAQRINICLACWKEYVVLIGERWIAFLRSLAWINHVQGDIGNVIGGSIVMFGLYSFSASTPRRFLSA